MGLAAVAVLPLLQMTNSFLIGVVSRPIKGALRIALCASVCLFVT